MTPPDWETLFSHILSGGFGAGVAKVLLKSVIKNFEELPKEFAELREEFSEVKAQNASILAKLEAIEEVIPLVHEHNKDIAVLKVQTNDNKRAIHDGKGRKVPSNP